MIRYALSFLAWFLWTIYLSLTMTPAAAQPPAPVTIRPPDGITLHYTNPQLFRDRTGTLFAATRAPSSIGGVVWMQAPGEQSRVLLQLGPKEMYANGELVIWPDGTLWYVTVPQDGSWITAYQILEWTP